MAAGPTRQQSSAINWRADKFRFGLLVGKVVALDWAIGNDPGCDVEADYSFDQWEKQVRKSGTEQTLNQAAAAEGLPRMETGSVRFGNDWPGLFLRGDDALVLAASIRNLMAAVPSIDDPAATSALVRLEELAEVIERDVPSDIPMTC